MSYLVAKVAETERFLFRVKTHAIRRQRLASARERAAMRVAFNADPKVMGSKAEELWAIADQLVDAIDAGGQHHQRVRLCREIEGVTE